LLNIFELVLGNNNKYYCENFLVENLNVYFVRAGYTK
jgi:hypothetical protein